MSIGIVRALVLGLSTAILAACASSSILVGNARPPIAEEQVRVYSEPPVGYEAVALLEASDLGANGFSAQSRMNKVVNRLKGEAAALGANGILLQGMDNQYIGSVNSGYATANTYGNSAYATGVGYSAAQFSKVGRAIAIFVPANVAASPTPLPAHELQAPSPPAVTPVPPRPAAATRPDASPGQPASDSSWRKWGKNGE